MNPDNGEPFKIVVRVEVVRDGETMPALIQSGRAPVLNYVIDAQRLESNIKFSGVQIGETPHPKAFDNIMQHVFTEVIPTTMQRRADKRAATCSPFTKMDA